MRLSLIRESRPQALATPPEPAGSQAQWPGQGEQPGVAIPPQEQQAAIHLGPHYPPAPEQEAGSDYPDAYSDDPGTDEPLYGGEDLGFEWHDPDEFWGIEAAVTFSFIVDRQSPGGGILVHAHGLTHYGLWRYNVMDYENHKVILPGLSDEAKERMLEAIATYGNDRLAREKAGALDGRVSGPPSDLEEYGTHFVSFWADDPQLYEAGLENCLRALFKEGLLAPDSAISTPLGPPFKAHELETFLGAMETGTRIDHAEVERRRELHLLKQGKGAALRALGARPKGQEPWSAELARQGLGAPGAKKWAFTSEGTVRRLRG